jgi:hypothetical protein
MDCKKEFDHFEEEIAKVDSAKQVRSIIENIAVTGNYTAVSFIGGFVVYSICRGNIVEELTGHKIKDRQYQVIRGFRKVESGGE